jgi:hypothetical protein
VAPSVNQPATSQSPTWPPTRWADAERSSRMHPLL